jgi:hypothetical protein
MSNEFLRKRVEPYIDKLYLESPLLKRHRDVAVIHLLRVFEDSIRIEPNEPFSNRDRDIQFHLRLRFSHEAIPWSLRWVWTDCPLAGQANLDMDWSAYRESRELMALSHKYYQLCRYFILYSRGFFLAETSERERRVRFYFRSETEQRRDAFAALDEIVRDNPPPSMTIARRMLNDMKIIRIILPNYIDKVDETSVRCDIPAGMMSYFSEWSDILVNEMRLDLPADWQFGSFNVQQFTRFWKSIMAVTVAHSTVHDLADDSVKTRCGAVGSIIIRTDEKQLIEATKLFPIPIDSARSIIEALTYQPIRDYWDPFWQPFIKISDGSLLCSPSLISTSSAQRNLISLLTHTDEGRNFYNQVSVQKEEQQLSELTQLFDPFRYLTRTRIPIARANGSTLTDIDLIVYDRTENSILLIHAKWLLRPDTVQEVLARDKEIQVALDIATKSATRISELGSGWMRTIFDTVMVETPQCYSIVINRDFVPSGWIHNDRIPVVTAGVVSEFVRSIRFTGLGSLYHFCGFFDEEVAKKHPIRFSSRDIEFGEYIFEVPTYEPVNA